MRRKYFGLAMAAVATLGPAQVYGGDQEIAQSIMERLKQSRDAGELKDFSLDMKVDEGVVLFRGKVVGDQQRKLVLDASEGIEGIRDVVDELEVAAAQVAASKPAKIYRSKSAAKPVETAAEEAPQAALAKQDKSGFDFAHALASPAESGELVPKKGQEVVPGTVQPTAAYEGAELNLPMPAPAGDSQQSSMVDEQLTQAVVRAIGRAQTEGYIKNFGVDVNVSNGMIELKGHAASQEQSQFIAKVAEHAPGARGVRNHIEIQGNGAVDSTRVQPATHRTNTQQMASSGGLQPLPPSSAMQRPMPGQMPGQMTPQQQMQRQQQMQAMQAQMRMRGGVPAQAASYGNPQVINGERVVPGSIVNHGPTGNTYGGPANGQYSGGAPMMGQPVPMAAAAPAGAPRYDSPNLPNYAWPGYAANSNYAAVSYPQQYSPSAFPFIGPFYPYPQVPLGWRKVSLEWDDGWWFLDFTDK
ncbi:BON domain-containing protein [Allorhodopirellula solitaria]|uniref:Periplasmic protein n=1 Tax=Allorhodopirellula solitaria TaxID=2527987 RepID=A0A5C5YCR3_9BACT|nr:BON domain-containing protein [Allorhodopirellula solitaria]TWT73170.1 periplasmic protein [Allorhodopirellula solitaria]